MQKWYYFRSHCVPEPEPDVDTLLLVMPKSLARHVLALMLMQSLMLPLELNYLMLPTVLTMTVSLRPRVCIVRFTISLMFRSASHYNSA